MRNYMLLAIVAMGILLYMCKKQADQKFPQKPSTQTEGVTPNLATQPQAEKPKEAIPKSGLPAEIMCKDSCLLLAEHSFNDVAQKLYCEKCKDFDEDACSLDWPSSDVMGCEEWDYMRNCIFARYGYVFKKEKWKQKFLQKTWYKENPAFSKESLTQQAKDNIAFLKKEAKECRKHKMP